MVEVKVQVVGVVARDDKVERSKVNEVGVSKIRFLLEVFVSVQAY